LMGLTQERFVGLFCWQSRLIDCVQPIAEFELLVLDKSFKFTAASSAEKDAFIRQLYKVN